MANQIKNIGDILPYTAITNDTIICNSNNQKTVTAVLEINLCQLDHDSILESKHNKIMNLINEFPDNTYVQLYYTKLFEKKNVQNIQDSRSSIINYIEKINNKAINDRMTPTYKNYMSITIQAEKKVDSDGVEILNKIGSREEKKDYTRIFSKAIEKLNVVVKQFESSAGGVYRLDSAQITQFISLLLNKEFMVEYSEISNVFKSDFNFSYNGLLDRSKGAYIYYGNRYHLVMSQRTNDKESRLPDKSTIRMNRIFDHPDLKRYPFIIQHTIRVLSKREGLAIAKKRENRITGRETFSKFPLMGLLAKTPEGLPADKLKELVHESIELVEQTNHKFLFQSFQMHLWADTLEELDNTYENVNAVVWNTYPMKREKYNCKAAFYSLFPGNEKINSIYTCLDSKHISRFLPIDMPRINYLLPKDKFILRFHTEEDQLLEYDMFSKQADNWNSMVIGGSGSGKSFLVNNLLYQFGVYDPQVAIVDYGGEGAGSYRNFVINQNGTYLEISLDSKDFSINPFDGPLFDDTTGEMIKSKYTALLSTIERMVTSKYKDIFGAEKRHTVIELIKKYFKDTNNNEGNKCNISEFAYKYLKPNPSTEILFKALVNFIGEGENAGPYANFFRASQEIKSKDVVCFDMAGLKGHEELKNVLVPALLNMIATNILGAKGEEHRKKLLIMDEAWQDLKGGSMRDFMEEMFRTVRKLNGQITIITQRFSDVLGSEICEALRANTSFYYFVGNNHDPEPLKMAKASSSNGAIELSDYDIDKIINCRSKRDFFLLTPFFKGLGKLYPTTEFIMLATTDPDDKNILRKYMSDLDVGYVTPEVIESARHEFVN